MRRGIDVDGAAETLAPKTLSARLGAERVTAIMFGDTAIMPAISRLFWFLLALLFLLEAWVWDVCAGVAARLVAILPWDRFRAAVAAGVARLPPWLVLFVFLIPGGVLLPFKLAGLWLIGTGHPVLGVATFFGAKSAAVGSAAFLFEICRPKLLELGWFVTVYGFGLRLRVWAHARVDPAVSRLRRMRMRLIPMAFGLDRWPLASPNVRPRRCAEGLAVDASTTRPVGRIVSPDATLVLVMARCSRNGRWRRAVRARRLARRL